ncbi:MAG: hypothetical protein B6242_14710 [Anaerolineaceae bacterium 4572_78]|nr:MAG: hypothetical protein B6242_14710 [Anaerolineaceae bacterium 4572_78]
MKIAVLSDIHDNIWNLEKALEKLEGVDAMIFLGDFCAPFTLKQIADAFRGPIHCIQGNNDGDMLLLMKIADSVGNVTFYNPLGIFEVDGKFIAFTHYPEIAEGLVATGKYSAVFYGHTHVFWHQKENDTLMVNPGEIMGRFGSPSFGYYDTDSGEFTRVVI